MISRIQIIHFDLMAWLKTFLKINWLIVYFQSIDEKSIVHWKVKLWLFGQNQVPRITIHQKMKLVHQEIKKSRFHSDKWKFLNLEIFLSVGNFIYFHNFEPIFHHDARWLKGNFQHESSRYKWYIKHFRTQLLI